MLFLNLLPLVMMVATPADDLQTIARGTLSGIERPRQVVVRNDEEWRALWKAHAPEHQPPSVDFRARTVIAVFLGSRNTAGYGVEVVSVQREDGRTTVHVREHRPGPDLVLAQIITTPFHIVSVARLDGPVVFIDDERR